MFHSLQLFSSDAGGKTEMLPQTLRPWNKAAGPSEDKSHAVIILLSLKDTKEQQKKELWARIKKWLQMTYNRKTVVGYCVVLKKKK